MVLPNSDFCGKSSGEDYVWQFMKDNNPENWVSFHNYDYDDRQPDVTLMVPNRGIIIIEIKSYLAKNIRAVPDRTKVLFFNKPPEKSSFDQALGYRDILTTAIKESKSVLSDAYVTVASCYPYITEQEYEEKSLNKISTRKLTILKDDFSNGHTFFEKINDILDVAYEAAKNPAKSCEFNGDDFERIGNLISPNFRNINENTETTTLENIRVKLDVDYYSKVVTFTRKASTEELKKLVDEWRNGGRIFAFFSNDENVDQLEQMVTDLMEKELIKTDLYKDFKPRGRKFNFTYQYVHNLKDELLIFNGDCREEEKAILQALDSISSFNYLQYSVEHAAQEHMIVKAGAGTGKTYSMISRIRYLIWLNKYSPEQLIERIVMITFTVDAAAEMRRKLAQSFMNSYVLTKDDKYLSYVECVENMNISTIHALAKKIIKKYAACLGLGTNFKIITGNYQKRQLIHTFLNDYISSHPEADFGIPFYQVEKRLYELANQLSNKNVDLLSSDEESADFGTEESVDGRATFSELIPVLREAEAEFRSKCSDNNNVALSNLIVILGELAEKIKNRKNSVDYLFVDEFQDTDDVQIKLISDYQKSFGFKIFAVGDIKQCIYRFRGAEVAAFDTLDSLITEDISEFSLRKNYRTDRLLLDYMNGLFEAWNANGDISYQGEDVLIGTLDINNSIQFNRIDYVEDFDRDELIKDNIIDLSRDFPGDTIAILVRTNNQALRVKRICEEAGISVVTPVGGNLFKIDPTIDLLKLLLALKYHHSAGDIYNLYTTSYVNEPLDKIEIDSLEDDQKVNHFYKNLPKALLNWNKYVDRLRLEPVLKVLRDIVEDVKPWVIFAEKTSNSSEENAKHRNFYRNNLDQLFETISLSSSFEYLTINSLIEYLETMIVTRQEEEEREGISSGEECNVYCTTVHKAKGLEYDHIILPFCEMDMSGLRTYGDADVIYVNNQVGYSIKESDIRRPRFVNSFYHSQRGDEAADRRLEEIRILYVAMTRAIKSMTFYSDELVHQIDRPAKNWKEMIETNQG